MYNAVALKVGEDAENYNSKRFFQARSFKLGLLASLGVLLLLLLVVAVVVGVVVGM